MNRNQPVLGKPVHVLCQLVFQDRDPEAAASRSLHRVHLENRWAHLIPLNGEAVGRSRTRTFTGDVDMAAQTNAALRIHRDLNLSYHGAYSPGALFFVTQVQDADRLFLKTKCMDLLLKVTLYRALLGCSNACPDMSAGK